MVCLLPQYPQNRAQAYIYSSCTINTCCLKDCRSPPLIYWCRVCVALGLERPKQAASVVLQPGQLTEFANKGQAWQLSLFLHLPLSKLPHPGISLPQGKPVLMGDLEGRLIGTFFWFLLPKSNLEIQPVHPKGNQSRIFIGRTDAEAETPILWPPDAKN